MNGAIWLVCEKNQTRVEEGNLIDLLSRAKRGWKRVAWLILRVEIHLCGGKKLDYFAEGEVKGSKMFQFD